MGLGVAEGCISLHCAAAAHEPARLAACHAKHSEDGDASSNGSDGAIADTVISQPGAFSTPMLPVGQDAPVARLASEANWPASPVAVSVHSNEPSEEQHNQEVIGRREVPSITAGSPLPIMYHPC